MVQPLVALGRLDALHVDARVGLPPPVDPAVAVDLPAGLGASFRRRSVLEDDRPVLPPLEPHFGVKVRRTTNIFLFVVLPITASDCTPTRCSPK